MTYQEVIRQLKLQPLPDEGGYFRQTWNSAEGTAIYFLLTPQKNGFSALHSLPSVEIYHFYAGDPVQMFLFPPPPSEGAPSDEIPLDNKVREIILGNKIDKGEIPQFAIPAGVIQGSRLISGGNWALLGTTMAPPYSPETFRLLDREELLRHYPEHRELIMQLTRVEKT